MHCLQQRVNLPDHPAIHCYDYVVCCVRVVYKRVSKCDGVHNRKSCLVRYFKWLLKETYGYFLDQTTTVDLLSMLLPCDKI